jgi:hypothetical protein
MKDLSFRFPSEQFFEEIVNAYGYNLSVGNHDCAVIQKGRKVISPPIVTSIILNPDDPFFIAFEDQGESEEQHTQMVVKDIELSPEFYLTVRELTPGFFDNIRGFLDQRGDANVMGGIIAYTHEDESNVFLNSVLKEAKMDLIGAVKIGGRIIKLEADGDVISAVSLSQENALSDQKISKVMESLTNPPSKTKWDDWRKEMAVTPSFQLIFNLVEASTVPGIKSLWPYFLNLLFSIGNNEQIIDEIVDLWGTISAAIDIHQDTKDYWASIAEKHDLPEAFIDAIKI